MKKFNWAILFIIIISMPVFSRAGSESDNYYMMGLNSHYNRIVFNHELHKQKFKCDECHLEKCFNSYDAQFIDNKYKCINCHYLDNKSYFSHDKKACGRCHQIQKNDMISYKSHRKYPCYCVDCHDDYFAFDISKIRNFRIEDEPLGENKMTKWWKKNFQAHNCQPYFNYQLECYKQYAECEDSDVYDGLKQYFLRYDLNNIVIILTKYGSRFVKNRQKPQSFILQLHYTKTKEYFYDGANNHITINFNQIQFPYKLNPDHYYVPYNNSVLVDMYIRDRNIPKKNKHQLLKYRNINHLIFKEDHIDNSNEYKKPNNIIHLTYENFHITDTVLDNGCIIIEKGASLEIKFFPLVDIDDF